MSTILAKRYAKALFEVAVDAGVVQRVVDEINLLGRLADINVHLQSADPVLVEFHNVMVRPGVSLEDRQTIMKNIIRLSGMGEHIQAFALYVLTKRRFNLLPEIARQVSALYLDYRNQTIVDVQSATAISAVEQDRLRAALERFSGKKVILNVTHNADLIAGLLIKIGDTVMDGSLIARLRMMRDAMGQADESNGAHRSETAAS